MHVNPLLLFIVACLGVIPLAGYMGEATEHLASRTGPTSAGCSTPRSATRPS